MLRLESYQKLTGIDGVVSACADRIFENWTPGTANACRRRDSANRATANPTLGNQVIDTWLEHQPSIRSQPC